MAITIRTPLYSFVQLAGIPDEGLSDCIPQIPLCLPVYELDDIAFQLIVDVSGADKDTFMVPNGITTGETPSIGAAVLSECGDGPTLGAPHPDIADIIGFNAIWTRIATGATDTWAGNFTRTGNSYYFDLLKAGDCFKIGFYAIALENDDLSFIVRYNTASLGCTFNCFQKISDPCFTSVFRYKCNENTFGFNYSESNLSNSVRLPCYLRDMQMPMEEKSYQKSDGSYIKLYERIDEEYELLFDFMPGQWHKKVKILLAHDQIQIINPNQTQGSFVLLSFGIVCREKYEITWPEVSWQYAPAKTRVRRSEALHLLNSNCA